MKTYIRYYIPVVLWMVTIFVFSSKQRVHISDVFVIQFAFFKMLHVIEYAFLYAAWYRALKNTTTLSQKKKVLFSASITLLFAISDEMHQTFVPTREGKFRDVVIDAIGITSAAYYLWKLLPKSPKILKNWAKNWQLL